MKFVNVLAAVLITGAPVAASATTLLDGSFETKGAATPVTNYCYDGAATPGGPACAASPWVGGGVIVTGSGAWGGTLAQDGSYYGFVQGLSVVSQSFTATSSTGLAVGWDAAQRIGYGNQTYTVTVTHGADVFLLGTYGPEVPGQFNPHTSTSFATVAGDNYTLSFSGLATIDATSFIDNVALSVVPEPATWGLMLGGFAMIGFAARRRRTAFIA